MIKLDKLCHRVSIGEITVELSPLTFDLFVLLHDHKGETLSFDFLIQEVWAGRAVSPEILKQRIFLLRQSLKDGGLDPNIIRSVHGRGYCLAFPEKRSEFGRFSKLGLGLSFAIFLFSLSWLFWPQAEFDIPAANRVVFWVDEGQVSSHVALQDKKQTWLNNLTGQETFSFIVKSFDSTAELASQAREARAGLISFWAVFETKGQTQIRMQLIEPKTGTVLRSDVAPLLNDEKFNAILTSQTNALNLIFQASLLPLTREALINSEDPVWEKLKTLAQGN